MTLDEAGVGTFHHFQDGIYAKETHIPAGVKLTQHKHKHDHASALVVGVADVSVDGETTRYEAPAKLTIKAGQTHEVTAVTDVEWWCIHETAETDPEKIDAELIA